MIESACQCGEPVNAPASTVGQSASCTRCGSTIYFIAAERLPSSGGGGDFDAQLVIQAGPHHVGDVILLGGIEPITIGKHPDCTIVLKGERVSRCHCKLVRMDFGPSQWEIQDNQSTNGLYINELKLEAHELQEGDLIQIGEYELRFALARESVPTRS